jgi:hypothetical protein
MRSISVVRWFSSHRVQILRYIVAKRKISLDHGHERLIFSQRPRQLGFPLRSGLKEKMSRHPCRREAPCFVESDTGSSIHFDEAGL